MCQLLAKVGRVAAEPLGPCITSQQVGIQLLSASRPILVAYGRHFLANQI